MNSSGIPVFFVRSALLTALSLAALPVMAVQTLSEVYLAAEAADPELAGQRATLDATRELRPQAEAVVNRPRLSAGGSINYNYQEIDAAFGSGTTHFDGRNWRINLTQPIYRADRRSRLSQADQQIQAQELRVDATRQALVSRVVDAYFNVLGAIDNLSFAEAEQDSLARQLEQTSERFEVGLIAITDVQEAQAGHDLAVAQAIAARNDVDRALEALREITGQYHDNLIPLATEFEPTMPEPADIELWTKTALEQNLRVSAALADAEAAGQAIHVAEAGRYPTVDAVGSTDFRQTGGQFGDARIFGGSVGLEVNVPLYTGGDVTSRTREAGYRHEAAMQALEQARRQAHRGARDAYNAVVNGVSRIRALRQAVVSTQTALEATQAGFEVGTRTTVEVVAAERDLSRARRDYARARYDYIVASVQLREAAGTLDPLILKDIDAFLAGGPVPGDQDAPLFSQD
jgi:outer membrane protein